MNKIIATCGYMGSGSSAMTDLLCEFKGYRAVDTSKEYVFLHCPDGVFDLEDKLLVGNSTLRSDEAFNSFERCMRELYDKKHYWVGGYRQTVSQDFMIYVSEFIESLVDIHMDNHWYYHENPNFSVLCRRIINKVLKNVTGGRIVVDQFLYPGIRIGIPDEEQFYNSAKSFLQKIYRAVGSDESSIVFDQLLLPSNSWRIPHYFDDNFRCLVVDRDPRDVFLLNKYYWKDTVPYPYDAEDFCKYYRKLRNMEKPVSDGRILRIHFEDMIYRYDETLKTIMRFLGVEDDGHIFRKQYFDPDVSIRNTQIFTISDKYNQDRMIIEDRLPEYLYGFPEDKRNIDHNGVF